MLQFSSASLRLVNSQRAIEECLDVALGAEPAAASDCSLVVIHASLGHPLKDLVEPVRRRCPRARVVASSCCGVVGKEGVSESMKDVAIMAVRGPDPEALDIILKGADRIVQVSDAEVTSAMRAYYEDTHQLTEGAGAASLAALMQERDRMKGRRIGLILSGGNIDREVYLRTLAGA